MLRKYRSKNTKCGEAGFTLVELIIVIVLTSLLGVFGFQMLAQSLLAQRNMQLRKEHSDDAVMVLDKISRELRQASAIYTDSANDLSFLKYDSTTPDDDGDGEPDGLYVLYLRDTVTWELNRYELAATGAGAGDRGAAIVAGRSLVAEDVFGFTPSVASDVGDISLQFDGEDSPRTTSVRIRNVVP